MSALFLMLSCVMVGTIIGVVAMSLAVMSKDIRPRDAKTASPLREDTSS